MGIDANSELKLSAVHPLLATEVRGIITDLPGDDVRVVQGLRTFAEQDKLYRQPHDGKDNDGDGRIDEPDEHVTNARGGQSNHNYGLAVDLCPFTNGKPDWNNTAAFQRIGAAAKARGLAWGGDWKKFKDMPHVQLPCLTTPNGSPSDECKTLYLHGGLSNVWARASEILGTTLKTSAAEPKGVSGQSPTEDAGTGNPKAGTPTSSEPSPVLRLLKRGDKGDDVLALQNKLFSMGYKLERSGTFDDRLDYIIRKIQESNHLDVDGKVGKDTRRALGL